MKIVTNGYIFINPNKDEKNSIINNTVLEHKKKYGDNYFRKIEFIFNIQFFDEKKTKQKILRLIVE